MPPEESSIYTKHQKVVDLSGERFW